VNRKHGKYRLTKQTYTKDSFCPVCTSEHTHSLVQINDVPVFCNVLCSSQEEALQVPKGDIHLSFCHQCGHVFNRVFDPNKLNYSEKYENSLHYSPFFHEYAVSLAKKLVEKYQLHHKDVIDIGCGQGEFLNLLCQLGESKGIGFDPSYEKDRPNKRFQNIAQIIQDYYSEKYAAYPADFIACRHVLEHIQSPRSFLGIIHRAIGTREDPILFFEVPNAVYTLKNFGIWDLIYEHCGYFTKSSLSHLFRVCNFHPHHLEEAFGGQYLCIEASLSSGSSELVDGGKKYLDELKTMVERFPINFQQKVRQWKEKIREFEHKHENAIVWSAGSKGVMFLNLVDQNLWIDSVVDINPNKHGMFVSGTGHKIFSPDIIKHKKIDKVIIMNSIYKEEIQTMLKEYGLECEILLA
jgi:SAM-dependent methyltransferase